MELVTRIADLKLRRIIFRKASRTHGYFLSSNAHARLDTFDAIGIQIYWYDELTKEIYLHVYKKEHGFFVREELARKFQEATILAFYGSAVGLDKADTDRISGPGRQAGHLHRAQRRRPDRRGRRRDAPGDRPGAQQGRPDRRLLPRARGPAARSSASTSSTPSRNPPGISGRSGSKSPIFASSTSAASAPSRRSGSSCATSSSGSGRACPSSSSTRSSSATCGARSAR